ncbi:AVN_collapsed_G0046590.mRNA.1.CDS.1 [Saccharomyces cerevisiae]|nr:AVN_collapsed_G0046590.mRNA.1.CDS.1 [Saccharomyces cerevisiae]
MTLWHQVTDNASLHFGGRETCPQRVLYVGNLDKAITEDILKQYFQVGGPIANIKIMIDKNNKNHNPYTLVM